MTSPPRATVGSTPPTTPIGGPHRAGSRSAVPRSTGRDQQRRHDLRRRPDVHHATGLAAAAARPRAERERSAGQRDRVHQAALGRSSLDSPGPSRSPQARRSTRSTARSRSPRRPPRRARRRRASSAARCSSSPRRAAHQGPGHPLARRGRLHRARPPTPLCTKHKAGDLRPPPPRVKTLQLLHASAHGKFRTKGRYSAATVLRHHLDRRRPLRRHPHPRRHRLGRGHRLRPPQDDRPPRRPELPRARSGRAK